MRLLLRKQGVWHRLDSLKYQNDLGEGPAIVPVIDEICQNPVESLSEIQEMKEEQEVIDLTLNDEPHMALVPALETHNPSAFRICNSVDGTPETSTCSTPKPIILAESELHMNLDTLLGCLRIDELKTLAKTLQLKPSQRVRKSCTCLRTMISNQFQKQELISTILRISSSQSILSTPRDTFPVSTTYFQTECPSGRKRLRIQQERVREMALRLLSEYFGPPRLPTNILQSEMHKS